MKVKVKDIKGELISINPAENYYMSNIAFDINMRYEGYNVKFYKVEEKDITVIMDK